MFNETFVYHNYGKDVIMNFHEQKIHDLLSAYNEISKTSSPNWAVHKRDNPTELIKCTIPFVGKHYFEQAKRILVYASAENLSSYSKSNWPIDLENDNIAQNRHRNCFENIDLQSNRFFPHVHIEPMNDGMLATAVLYIASKYLTVDNCTPREFYETIAFANLGKYSIDSDTNIDYTKLSRKVAFEKLSTSLPYLKADIETLQPHLIILPKTLYHIIKTDFDNIAKGIPILPIYQLNRRTINCTISRRKDNPKKDVQLLSPNLVTWGKNISKVSFERYLHVLTYLDTVVEQYSIQENS